MHFKVKTKNEIVREFPSFREALSFIIHQETMHALTTPHVYVSSAIGNRFGLEVSQNLGEPYRSRYYIEEVRR